MKNIAILGSTGSIGTQTLDIVREQGDIRVWALTAGKNVDLLEKQIRQIQQWIREERLEFTADSPVKIPCENCGEMIRSGKYCEKCKREMTNNLSSVMEKPKAVHAEPKKTQPSGNKMRFLDR